MTVFDRMKTLLFSLALLLSITAPAAAEISFSVSPIRVELSGEPGGTSTDAVEIINEGTEKVRIKVSMQDWYLSEDGTPVFQKAGSQTRSCTGWLKINPVDFLLQPGEKKLVRYSVAIPAGITPGGYWSAFVFETVPQAEPGQRAKAVAIKGNIASIIYVTAGKPSPSGEIIDMSRQETGDGTRIDLRLKNTGNVQFRTKGDVRITDASGKPVQTIDIPDAPVLAGYSRTLSLPLKEKLRTGSYTAVATVDVGAKAILAGEISFSVK